MEQDHSLAQAVGHEECLVTPLAVTGALVPGKAQAWESQSRSQALKRGLDIVGAALLLLVALPLVVTIVVAIVVESAGPVFYRAERVGRGGRSMRMLKFRKMYRNACGPHLTARDDQRLTRVGVILARTKLDELPQLINVLRGEMSLVGPRPEDPEFVAARHSDYVAILKVRPGITGLSQLAFADESRILSVVDPVGDYLERILPQKCALDRLYIRDSGVRRDLTILGWTLIGILLRRPIAVDRETGALGRRRRRKPVNKAPDSDSNRRLEAAAENVWPTRDVDRTAFRTATALLSRGRDDDLRRD